MAQGQIHVYGQILWPDPCGEAVDAYRMSSEEKDTDRGDPPSFANFDFGSSAFRWFAAQEFAALQSRLPPNWDNKVRFRDARTLVQSDGLPVIWVPRADIIRSLVHAGDLNERKNILIQCLDEVVEDCKAVLADVSHPKLRNQALLASRAVDALASGHFEAAQALAVVVTETAVAKILGRDYSDVKEKVFLIQRKPRSASRDFVLRWHLSLSSMQVGSPVRARRRQSRLADMCLFTGQTQVITREAMPL